MVENVSLRGVLDAQGEAPRPREIDFFDFDGRARARRFYWPSLPGRARAQCSYTARCCVTAVVPAHRCGAVPDSHRVPSCLTKVNQRRDGSYILWPYSQLPPQVVFFSGVRDH